MPPWNIFTPGMLSLQIPNQFHFVYGLKPETSPFHLIHYLCLESCLRVNQPERIFFYYHHRPWGQYWDLIRDKIIPMRVPHPAIKLQYTDPRIERYRYAHEADFLRLDVLIDQGGVYADMDTIFVNPLPSRLLEYPFVLGRENDVRCHTTGEVKTSLCNALIMSAPRAEFAMLYRQQMEQAFDGSWSGHSTILPADLAAKHPSLIHIEPSHRFYSYMWTQDDLHRLLGECEQVGSDVASIHLWAHLWWSEQRRDFSGVHAGMFTEDYLRNVNTTYNLLARPYLPPIHRPCRATRRRVADLVAQGINIFHKVLRRGRRALRRWLAGYIKA